MSLLGQEPTAAGGTPRWGTDLEIVERVLGARAVWVPVQTSVFEEFAQVVGLSEHGGAVAVRVSDESRALNRDSSMTGADALRCGPVTVSAGASYPYGSEEDLTSIMRALVPVCTALIEAGEVEAETLAEVYWD